MVSIKFNTLLSVVTSNLGWEGGEGGGWRPKQCVLYKKCKIEPLSGSLLSTVSRNCFCKIREGIHEERETAGNWSAVNPDVIHCKLCYFSHKLFLFNWLKNTIKFVCWSIGHYGH